MKARFSIFFDGWRKVQFSNIITFYPVLRPDICIDVTGSKHRQTNRVVPNPFQNFDYNSFKAESGVESRVRRELGCILKSLLKALDP